MTEQTKQATTGVVAVARAWSGAGAFAFGMSTALASNPAIRYTGTRNHGTDLSPVSGTLAWSPPV
jgi:hypothetical protein